MKKILKKAILQSSILNLEDGQEILIKGIIIIKRNEIFDECVVNYSDDTPDNKKIFNLKS